MGVFMYEPSSLHYFYKPLVYQRFYDWPPEPLFTEVQPDIRDEARRRRTLNNLTKGARRGSERRPSILFYKPGGIDLQDLVADRNGVHHDKSQ